MVTRKQFRRKLHSFARRRHLYRLAAYLDPGPLVRLWDEDFNLIADSDLDEGVIPARITVDEEGIGRIEWRPSTTVTVGRGGHSGHLA